MNNLKALIREVPDFTKPGIIFYDITTLLKHPEGLRQTVDALAAEFAGMKIDSVVGIEARGFIFAPALAYHLGAGFGIHRHLHHQSNCVDRHPNRH